MQIGSDEIQRKGTWGRILDEEGFQVVRDRIKKR